MTHITFHVSPERIRQFNRAWPCSKLKPAARFIELDSHGEVCDHDFPPEQDGPELVAFIDDVIEENFR